MNKTIVNYKYFFVLIITLLLLLVFISVSDIQLTMFLGGWLFFISALLLSKHFNTRSLIGLFLFSFISFFIIGYIYFSLKYFDEGVSWRSALSMYPAFLLILLYFSVGSIIGILIRKLIRNKTIVRYCLISITCMVFAFLSGWQGWPFQFVFTGVIFFIAGFINQATSVRQLGVYYFMLIIPFSLVYSSIILINGSTHAYPIVAIPLISSFIGIFCNYQIRKPSFKFGLGLSFIYLIILGMGYWGMKNYLQFIFGLSDSPYVTEIRLNCYNSSDTSFNNNDLLGKTAVIYFHTKSCKVCYEKLPELESLYEDFKDDTTTIVIAAFIPYNQYEDSSFIFNYYRKHGFTYPQFQTREGFKEYERRFNIDGYPHVTIISKNGDIIHNGLFNNDPTVFVDNARSLVLSDKSGHE